MDAPAQTFAETPPSGASLAGDLAVVAARAAVGAGVAAALDAMWVGVLVLAVVGATTAAVERRALRQAARSTRGLLAWALLAGLVTALAVPGVGLNAVFVHAAATGGPAAGWVAVDAELRDLAEPGLGPMLAFIASFGGGGAAGLCVAARLLRASRVRRGVTPFESRALGALAGAWTLLAVALLWLVLRSGDSGWKPSLGGKLERLAELAGLTAVASVVWSLALLLLALVVDPLALRLARLVAPREPARGVT